MTFSKNPRRGVYYDGELIEGEFFDENSVLRLAQKFGVGEIRIKVDDGEFVNRTFNIVGVLKTPRRNLYIVQKSYTLKVRG